MLKAQLHIHVKGDPKDKISYAAEKLIDEAAQQNFDVLSFTCHDKVVYGREVERYARQKNILLIPGVEKTIEGKHVLLYNLTDGESQQITSFQKLNEFKLKKQKQNQPFLVAAAHPFHFGFSCLKNKVIQCPDLFDAWEYSFFYHRLFNPNKKTIKLARKYKKPLIGSSDVHHLGLLEKTYSLIDSEKNVDSVFQAIKNNRIEIKTRPLSFFSFSKVFLLVMLSTVKQLIGKNRLT